MRFADKLAAAWKASNSLVCVGLDPEPKKFPDEFRDAQAKLLEAYSAQTDSHFVDLSEPALRTHYLESGHGDAVLMQRVHQEHEVLWGTKA